MFSKTISNHHSAIRPKLLYIATTLPWPLNCGYKIRLFENLRALAKFCDITVVSMVETDQEKIRSLELANQLSNVTVTEPILHKIHIRKRPVLLAKMAIKSLISRKPYKVVKFASAKMKAQLRNIMAESSFDMICAELATWDYVRFIKKKYLLENCHAVLDTHNVESELIYSYASNQRWSPMRRLGRIESSRTRLYEQQACREADMILTISDEDSKALSEMISDFSKTEVVPALASDEVGMAPTSNPKPNNILFIGQLSWPPNEEAILWFIEKAWPIIRMKIPDVKMRVVGSGLTDFLKKQLLTNGIEGLGYVQDLGPIYNCSRVFVSPFLSAGGVRIKLLDAMKAGIPIVSTSIGCKGLPIVDGEHALFADEPKLFADAVCRIINDPALAENMVANCLHYLNENHSRQTIASRMAEILNKLGVLENRADPLATRY